jgi:hypothetical protein
MIIIETFAGGCQPKHRPAPAVAPATTVAPGPANGWCWVPFPMSFYAKDLEGHIDNPDAGWKGRGLWTPRGPGISHARLLRAEWSPSLAETPGITGSAGPPDQPTAALVHCTVTFGAANRI